MNLALTIDFAGVLGYRMEQLSARALQSLQCLMKGQSLNIFGSNIRPDEPGWYLIERWENMN